MTRRLFRKAIVASPPAIGARLAYLEAHGRLPDLDRPRRFTEHLLRQKLFGDHARFAELSDKVRVKAHVARTIGPGFVTPTLWHGPALPPRGFRDWPLPFVLKANHGSGMNALVRGPGDLDWDRLEAQASAWLARDWPRRLHEEWYNRIERQLLVEPLLGCGSHDLTDYKFWVFGGRAELVQVDLDRFSGHRSSIFDRDWRMQPVRVGEFPLVPGDAPRPRHFERMLAAAETLGRGFDFVRVDFYDLPDGPRFGEMTFSPGAGLLPMTPERFDVEIGGLWRERVPEGP